MSMFTQKIKELYRENQDYKLFLLVCICVGIGQSIDGATLNNFLKEEFNLVVMERSLIEIPRELPGLLVFVFTGALFALGDIRIAAVANFSAAIGMFLFGFIPTDFFMLLMVIFIYSTGMHLFMPMFSTIGMSFAKEGQYGKKLGQISAANTAALVLSSAIMWFLFKFFEIGYTIIFAVGGLSFLAAAILLMKMDHKRMVPIKQRFVFRKEFRLYYWLSILYGARKQIFITFAPWVLVEVYKQQVTTMTMLFFIISVLGIFVKPLIGSLIDRIGERSILVGEAAVFLLICLGYAFAEDLFQYYWALIAVCICYIIDQTSLSAVTMARATYIKKISPKEEFVAPTLSLGLSIDHIVSMFIPVLGGLLWFSSGAEGYKLVFMGGALIAMVNLISAMAIKVNNNSTARKPV